MPMGSELVVFMRSPARPNSVKAQIAAMTANKKSRRVFSSGRPLMRIRCDSRSVLIRRLIVFRPRYIVGRRLVLGTRRLNDMAALHNDFVDHPLAAILGRELAGL